MIPINESAPTVAILTPSCLNHGSTSAVDLDGIDGSASLNSMSITVDFDSNFKQVMDALQVRSLLAPFSDITVEFLTALANSLMQTRVAELVALGFWLRKKHLRELQVEFESHYTTANSARSQMSSGDIQASRAANQITIAHPLGCVFHVTPANVDTMFIYSWVCSLLVGNSNIVRVSQQESPIKKQLLITLRQLLQQARFAEIAKRNVFVQYQHQQSITSYFSARADARVLWGGDEAIRQIRQVNAKPTTRDISFADRYSVALINLSALASDSRQRTQQITELALRLWRDTKPYSQLACSSPKCVLWLGDRSEHQGYLDELLGAVNALALPDAEVTELKTQHLVTAQLAQAKGYTARTRFNDGILAIELNRDISQQATEQLIAWHTGQGCFYLRQVRHLQEVTAMVGRRCQTLSVWGVTTEDLVKLLGEVPIAGIDRVVAVGQALDFQPIWDGYDLLAQLSRVVTVSSSTQG